MTASPSAEGITRQELEHLIGFQVTAKHVFMLDGDGKLWHRDGDLWYRYRPYPPYPDFRPDEK